MSTSMPTSTAASLTNDFEFPNPAPVGIIAFLGIYNIIYLFLLCYVVGCLFHYRRHRMLLPRNVATLIPFQLFSFVSCVIFSLSIILGKPRFCEVLDAMYITLPVMAMHFNLNTPEMVFQSDLNSLKVTRAQARESCLLFYFSFFLSF